ncbi:diguanylate cyclase domain-containing protein [Actinoplanes sp. NPDC049599]|uniref:diguanylate cyclase domain-containing protein n=1 Tax=Actinoplanes sp. NPDC049599 TaxID=3363903 RepID=UPI0037B5D252
MTEGRTDASTRETAISTWLRRAPDAVAIALDRASLRVPLPAAECFRGVATLPGAEATFVDSVVAADRMNVVETWEHAQRRGMAEATVRMLSEPGRARRLRFVDAREFFGVWIGLLADQGPWQEDTPAVPPAPAMLAPRRPRTGTLRKNLYAVITEVDDRFTQMLGWPAAEMLGRRSLEFMHPDDHERAIAQWLEVRSSRSTQRVRVRHRHRDGRWVWVEVENVFISLDDPDATMVNTLVTDISDEMAAHEAVRQQSRLLRRVADSLPLGLIVLNQDRTTVFANAGLPAVLGADGTPDLATVMGLVHADDRPRLAEAVAATLDQRADRAVEVALASVAGETRRCLFTLAALTDDEGVRGAVVSITDVTASSRLREDLTVRATRDPLTGCRNRASLRADLEHALSSEQVGQTAVLFIDLDRFKEINDTHGHHAGDQLLVAVTTLLRDALRADDVLGRWGGDEFLVICRQVHTPQEALAVARRLAATLAEPIRIAGTTMEATGSIGVAIATPGIAADELIAQADAAMYAAKQSARHRIAVHRGPAAACGEPTVRSS